jgi:hypothetical protein
MLPFMVRQMADEWRFFRHGKSRPVPSDSYNAIVNLKLSEAESARLMGVARRNGVGLNSLLNAAILLAHVKNNYTDTGGSDFRTIVFADLRPNMQPQPPEYHFGCFVSMLRFSLKVDTDTAIISLAEKLDKQVVRARRRGDLQLFSLISKHLVSLSMATKRMRLSNTALSFMGYLDLQPAYGPVRLLDVHAYITNNRLGAEFSGFGKVLFNRIELDFTYLISEMQQQEALELVRKIKDILKNID